MKLWRNAEGREFPASYSYGHELPDFWWGQVGSSQVAEDGMRLLGYELVDAEPVGPEGADEFEVGALGLTFGFGAAGFVYLSDKRLVPGKTYVVREKR